MYVENLIFDPLTTYPKNSHTKKKSRNISSPKFEKRINNMNFSVSEQERSARMNLGLTIIALRQLIAGSFDLNSKTLTNQEKAVKEEFASLSRIEQKGKLQELRNEFYSLD